MKKLMLILFSVVMGLISLQSVYADGYSTNQIETYTVVPNKNADIINLQFGLRDRYSSSDDYYYTHIFNEYRTRAFLADGKYRNPDNPNLKLYRSQNSLIKVSGHLSYISRVRAVEREFTKSEYRLNGQKYTSFKIGNIYPELEIYWPNEVSEQLEKDEQNWLNGKDASSLYKAIISPRIKSFGSCSGLFEFSSLKDPTSEDVGGVDVVIPVKAEQLKLIATSSTYLEVGSHRYVVDLSCSYNGKNLDSVSSHELYLSNFEIISSNEDVVNVGTDGYAELWLEARAPGVSNITVQIDGKNAVTYSVGVDTNPHRNSWQKVGNNWFFYDRMGLMQTNKWIGDYYVKSNGVMASNEWVGKYYVDGTGKWVPNKAKVTEGWHKTKEGAYWYQNSDGSYPKKQWKEIGKRWYHFNENGYMDHNKWIGDYYVKASGEMATNEWIGKYYVDSTGKWVPNKTKVTAGWHKTKEGAYWYQNSDGSYPKKQWQKINTHWYHFNDKGYMDHDKWIGYYYVKSSGEMAINEWIDKFYVDGTGKWDPKKVDTSYGWRKTKDGAFWYQEKNGSFPKNQWKQIDGQWYHFNESGYMDHNKWIGYYYVKSSGAMARNERIGIFYVGSDGLWQPGV